MSKTITDISGRGVGLDVVKSNIEALGGDVEVKTALGEGTTFTVRLPLTLAIIQALMVEVRDEKICDRTWFHLQPLRIFRLRISNMLEAQEVIHLRGMVIPIIHLDKLLDCEPKKSLKTSRLLL